MFRIAMHFLLAAALAMGVSVHVAAATMTPADDMAVATGKTDPIPCESCDHGAMKAAGCVAACALTWGDAAPFGPLLDRLSRTSWIPASRTASGLLVAPPVEPPRI
jgi:hypothetical protein